MDSDDDDMELFGTAFDQLESNEVASKKPDIDQTVRDEKGRRRFHGAFTGGYSAGYWNTVGSAEGFTPQMFKSSRRERNDAASSSKPEDFMDEEDFGAYGIAPKTVHTTNDFVDNLEFAGMRGNNLDDAVRSIFSSSHESIGKRLHRRMKASAHLEKRIKYGHELLMKDYQKRSKVETIKYQDVDFKCKDNFHGIGYTGALDANKFLYKPLEISAGRDSLMSQQNTIQTTISGGKKLKISGEAFGVGALEDDDEYGGMSVYFNEDMSQYDFELGRKEEKEKPKKKRKFKDTRNLDPNQVELEAFRRSKKSSNLFNELRKHYRLPELPKGWKFKRVAQPENVKMSRWDSKTSKPIAVSTISESTKENTAKSSLNTDPNQSNWKPKAVMNANVRSSLIGEEVVYKTGMSKNPTVVLEEERMKNPVSDTIGHVFKPLSGLLASKFTTSSASKVDANESIVNPDDVKLSAGLMTFKDVSASNQAFVMRRKNDTIYSESDDKVVDPPTRVTLEWHPHRLLCKRFGLQDPFVGDSHVGLVGSYKLGLMIEEKKKDLGKDKNEEKVLEKLKINEERKEKERKGFTSLFQNLNEVNDYYSAKDSNPGQEFDRFKVPEKKNVKEESFLIPSTPKASLQLLKSVFASDEEDFKSGDENDQQDSDEDSRRDEERSKREEPRKEEYSSKNISKERKSNTGLFAGIDFRAVNAQQFNDTDSLVYQSERSKLKDKEADNRDKRGDNQDDSEDSDGYGPSLPPPPSQSQIQPSNAKKSLDDLSQRSSPKRKKLKKEKKSKKSKKKSHKKEKKKKKDREREKARDKGRDKDRKRRHRDSDSDSDSSSNDGSDKEEGPDLDSQILAFIRQARENAT